MIYDPNGNRLTATDPELNLVQFDYDANGQLTLLTDAKGNETAWQYDVLGRTIRKDYDDGNFEQYFYDAANQLTSYRQPNASVIAYEYDTRGNVTKVDYPSMADVTFTYDKMNRTVTMTDALGTTTNAYDLMSRSTSSGGLWANDAVSYDYDNLGRRSELALNSRTVTFGYDNLSRLNAVNRGTDTFAYSYKANGSQLDEVDLPNGAKSTFSYDGLGRLTQIQDLKSTAANISKFAYGYDNRDVKTHVERALGTATTQRINYTYDDIDQLLTEISTELTPVVNNNFTYDAAQNRTASTVDAVNSSFTINNVNQVSAYTLGGSPITVTHDDNGNTTQLGPKALTWDDANRLTSVTVPGVSKSEYQYDGLDRRRIAKAYSWNAGTSSWDLQGERRFIYDGMDLIEERDDSNNLVAFYTRTGNIGEVLSRTTTVATFYYHYDGNGNVVSLTDSSENVVATYEYDAYGNLQASSGAEANNNPFRFSTKYFDAATGLYDYGFRFYDPITGRWLNRDPIGEDGGINLYAFVSNGAANTRDEYGLKERLKGARVEFWNNSSFGVTIVFDTEHTPGGAGPKKRVAWKLKVPAGYRTTMKIDVDYVQPQYGGWMHFYNPVGAFADLLPFGIHYKHPGKTCEATDQYKGLFRHPTTYELSGTGVSKNNNPKTGFPIGFEGGLPNGPSPMWIMPVKKALQLGYIIKTPQKSRRFKVTFK